MTCHDPSLNPSLNPYLYKPDSILTPPCLYGFRYRAWNYRSIRHQALPRLDSDEWIEVVW